MPLSGFEPATHCSEIQHATPVRQLVNMII